MPDNYLSSEQIAALGLKPAAAKPAQPGTVIPYEQLKRTPRAQMTPEDMQRLKRGPGQPQAPASRQGAAPQVSPAQAPEVKAAVTEIPHPVKAASETPAPSRERSKGETLKQWASRLYDMLSLEGTAEAGEITDYAKGSTNAHQLALNEAASDPSKYAAPRPASAPQPQPRHEMSTAEAGQRLDRLIADQDRKKQAQAPAAAKPRIPVTQFVYRGAGGGGRGAAVSGCKGAGLLGRPE
jgi:hypothetical protein